jgi:hypothetical protein
MANRRTVVAVITLLCCSVLLTGCDDKEKEKAFKEIADLKTKLAKVEADLIQVTAERDALKTAADEAITLREKVDKLTKERNMALDKARNTQVIVEELQGQLAKQGQTTKQEQMNEQEQVIRQEQAAEQEQETFVFEEQPSESLQ